MVTFDSLSPFTTGFLKSIFCRATSWVALQYMCHFVLLPRRHSPRRRNSAESTFVQGKPLNLKKEALDLIKHFVERNRWVEMK